MIARPFVVRCFETAPAGVLEVAARFPATALPTDEDLSLLERLMGHFIVLAARGGLAGDQIEPVDSTLALTRKHIARDVCAWSFDQVRIAPASRMVLENILHFFHLHSCRVAYLDLVVSPGSPLANSRDAIPALFMPPPFEWLVEPEASEVVIDLDFVNPAIDASVTAQFTELWDSWLYVSTAAGFESEDFSARSLTIFPSGEPELVADQLSFFMDDVAISMQAFDALINGFCHLHFTTAPLSRVHIY